MRLKKQEIKQYSCWVEVNIMKNMNKIIDYINFHIELTKEKFTGEWTVAHTERMARTDGMIDILSIITGKSYKTGGKI